MMTRLSCQEECACVWTIQIAAMSVIVVDVLWATISYIDFSKVKMEGTILDYHAKIALIGVEVFVLL